MAIRDIVLAGGCFWGTEAFLQRIPGIIDTECGYANAVIEKPTYAMVCSGETQAAEAVHVRFDDAVLPLPVLLEAFLTSIDPTSLNRQGNDIGTQYRSGIYWTNPTDKVTIQAVLQAAQAGSIRPIVVEGSELTSFYPAEEEHQDYLAKNPGGYCHVDLSLADKYVKTHSHDFKSTI